MKLTELVHEVVVPRPLPEVHAFFADPANLEQLTPPWLSFRIATPPPLLMRTGAVFDYRIRMRGLPLRWRSRISIWDPPRRFVDVQERGPFRRWEHEHSFEEANGGTRVRDRIRYAVWGGALVDRWLVRRDVERIFAFRAERMSEMFGGGAGGPSGRLTGTASIH